MDRLQKLGIKLPEILLPSDKVKMDKWVTIACDQYTTHKDVSYWDFLFTERHEELTTLQLILPEVYLADQFEKKRKEILVNVNKNMLEYEKKLGAFKTLTDSFIYVERTVNNGLIRRGLVMAIDLENYSYIKGEEPLFRPTEKTIPDRIPPRLKIRENATIELPHILVVVDDPDRNIIEKIPKSVNKYDMLYDFDFSVKGQKQHLKGFRVSAKNEIERITAEFEKLVDPKNLKKKYDLKEEPKPILFAIGDGNHSLATAKTHWERVKKAKKVTDHPARYCLIELINLYDDSIPVFQPIHRVMFGINAINLIEQMKNWFKSEGCLIEYWNLEDDGEKKLAEKKVLCEKEGGHFIPIYFPLEVKKIEGGVITVNKVKNIGYIHVKKPKSVLEVATLQGFINHWLDQVHESKRKDFVDYVHETNEVKKHGGDVGNMGFILPQLKKGNLFKSVIENGVCPRKTFSIGHADEKRCYLEARKIV